MLRALLAPATTSSSPTTPTAARTGSSTRSRRPWGVEHSPRRSPTSTPCAPRSARGRPGWSGSRRPPTRCSASPTSRRSPRSPTTPARCSSSTTPSPRPTCSSRSPSAPTSSCTPRPSTSAATPTSSAARSSCARHHAPGYEDAEERIAFHQNAMGAVAGPFDALLTLRGLKTLAVRMDRHCDNAEKVVEFLTATPASPQVLYPGLPEPPRPRRRRAADEALRRHGLLPGQAAARTRRSRSATDASVLTLGESLGGVESLIEHPGRMTHAERRRHRARGAERPHPAVGRHRGRRRPHRRPARGPRHPRLSHPDPPPRRRP